jgi:SAM-dependent methyltransferase
MATFENGQGVHLDPRDPSALAPDLSTFSRVRREAASSATMKVFRGCLTIGEETDVRAGVLDDLSTFYGFSRAECVDRCLHWEEWSVNEWKKQDRNDPNAITEFYKSTESWSFDLLWYAYLQAVEYAYPVSVAIAESLRRSASSKGEHLDFGSGVGVTGQLFSRLGYRSSLADISTTLQKFAKFRLDRRGDQVSFIDLNEMELEPNRYDVITAIDTLVHIPNLPATMAKLHRALRPGGVLFANFDTRPKEADGNQWHLYSDDLDLRYRLHRVGFEPVEQLDFMSTRYQRVDTDGLMHAARGVRDRLLIKSPLRPAFRAAKSQMLALAKRVVGSRTDAGHQLNTSS